MLDAVPDVVKVAVLQALLRVARQQEPKECMADGVVCTVIETLAPTTGGGADFTRQVFDESCRLMMGMIRGDIKVKCNPRDPNRAVYY